MQSKINIQKVINDYINIISKQRLEMIQAIQLVYADGYISNKGLATMTLIIEKHNKEIAEHSKIVNEVNQRLRNLD